MGDRAPSTLVVERVTRDPRVQIRRPQQSKTATVIVLVTVGLSLNRKSGTFFRMGDWFLEATLKGNKA